ncbi:hypothetical protein [Rhizobium sp. Leaf262]|uniref:hypothetical protein n=1 Tax=Rhizobium sp. Leaf262 TaxID=1736312 RepID=UPI0007142B4B|nr:hypothetical protein [Rhizobium sp. Leaf262]KQO80233.1 hypothetical protein ASF29_19945 [Rhizobium sp. Leaf262]
MVGVGTGDAINTFGSNDVFDVDMSGFANSAVFQTTAKGNQIRAARLSGPVSNQGANSRLDYSGPLVTSAITVGASPFV